MRSMRAMKLAYDSGPGTRRIVVEADKKNRTWGTKIDASNKQKNVDTSMSTPLLLVSSTTNSPRFSFSFNEPTANQQKDACMNDTRDPKLSNFRHPSNRRGLGGFHARLTWKAPKRGGSVCMQP